MTESSASVAPDTASRGSHERGRNGKSPSAFRTISEAADELDLPQHVLRFWESKFPQVKPLKRGGGRRYYRPEDIALLMRIRNWLHVEGYTIKGVQKLLKDPAQRNGGGSGTSDAAQAGVSDASGPHQAPVSTRDGDAVDEAIEKLSAIRRQLLNSLDP